uniref:ethanolamine kinase n=1 Tax=Geotrypetes seraphini TaxID=260995 RepID=A0A6P8RPR9_GEOSA|nr:ethanolamine kinase 1 isoform X1 [Geotrypetes seraphini]
MANYIHVPPGSPTVPRQNVTVEEQDCRAGAMRLLQDLRPHWKPETITTQVFTDGITNKLIGCYVGDTMDDVVLVRIYGNKTELLVDRDEELKSFRVLQAHGCAPQLYCTFNNGFCYEFMQGAALDPEHVCNPTIFRLIARQLAKIHAIHAHNGWIPKSNLWFKMGKYFSLVPTEFEDQEVNSRFLNEVPSFQVLQEEMAWMKGKFSNLGSPVVLCHNDLLCKNIIYNEKQGPDAVTVSCLPVWPECNMASRLPACADVDAPCSGRKPPSMLHTSGYDGYMIGCLSCFVAHSPTCNDVQFIDYEYSGYNYQAYDIGNHFNEFAGLNEVDYSLFPDRALQEQWLRSYLEAYKEYKGFDKDVSEKEVEVLYVQVNQFALASHFFWGLWALIQAKYSTIDFDFLGYAIVRLNQYFKMKPEVTALVIPE